MTDTPWRFTPESSPKRAGLPPLKLPVSKSMRGVRLYQEDDDRLLAMGVKISDFIREAVHEYVERIDSKA